MYIDDLIDSFSPHEQATAKQVAVTFDGVVHEATDDAAAYELTNIRMEAADAINSWIETSKDDLEDGETMVDRLDALIVGTLDADKDGDITDEEASVLELIYDAAADYLLEQGVAPKDVESLLSDGDEDTAERVVELLINVAPDGEDAQFDAVNNFAFSQNENSEGTYDAVYKRKMAVRGGKKVIIRKRVSGRVKLTAKQKMAVKKMLRKSHTAKARMKRTKSMKRRTSIGL